MLKPFFQVTENQQILKEFSRGWFIFLFVGFWKCLFLTVSEFCVVWANACMFAPGGSTVGVQPKAGVSLSFLPLDKKPIYQRGAVAWTWVHVCSWSNSEVRPKLSVLLYCELGRRWSKMNSWQVKMWLFYFETVASTDITVLWLPPNSDMININDISLKTAHLSANS